MSTGLIQAELLSGRVPLFRSITADLTTVHFTDLHPNSNGIGLDGNPLDDALDASLAAFTGSSIFSGVFPFMLLISAVG